MLASITSTLYELLLTQGTVPTSASRAEAGHSFEEETRQAIHTRLRANEGAGRRGKVFPPRYTLRLPTRSGLPHQFDGLVQDASRYTIIECKKREATQIDQLYAFVAKLTDYALGCRHHRPDADIFGIFYVTTRDLNDHVRRFALAYGIALISPDLPPVSYLAARVDGGTAFGRSLSRLEERVAYSVGHALNAGDDHRPQELLSAWRSAHQRWLQEGYGRLKQ